MVNNMNLKLDRLDLDSGFFYCLVCDHYSFSKHEEGTDLKGENKKRKWTELEEARNRRGGPR